MSDHARLSPSGAHGWMRCADWESNPVSTKNADEGTAAHELAAMALEADQDASAYLGRIITVGERQFEVDDDMVAHIQSYLDYVRAIPGERHVEQRLSIAHITGEQDAHGTSDCVVVAGDELVVVDLKFGANPNNRVDAIDNEQGGIYLLAALDEFGLVSEFTRARFVIHQPRCNHVSEWDLSIERLEAFRASVVPAEEVVPGEKQCKWCAKKATCPALTNKVLTTVADDFVDTTMPIAPQLSAAETRIANSDNAHVASCLASVELIESWCKAVRAKAETELLAGHPVPGYKLVEGRRGPRKWADRVEVEKALKTMRLKTEQMYDLSLISPTSAEKLHKSGAIGPRQWLRLQTLITQSDGSPSVAPESDKRPALQVTAIEDEFEQIA